MVATVTDNGPIQPLPISWKVTGNGVMVAMVEQVVIIYCTKNNCRFRISMVRYLSVLSPDIFGPSTHKPWQVRQVDDQQGLPNLQSVTDNGILVASLLYGGNGFLTVTQWKMQNYSSSFWKMLMKCLYNINKFVSWKGFQQVLAAERRPFILISWNCIT